MRGAIASRVNQALGVLEVRDEKGLRGFERSMQAAAESQDHRLFGHVSDSDLTRLGVDASILPVVRHLVSAMERTPSRVAFMAGQEELERMLANPFAAWRIFLYPAQRKIAYVASYAGPAQVTGGAGTGKTITALHRAAYLAGRYDAELPLWGDGPPILLTTFTRSLAAALDAQLAELVVDEEVRSRIEVLNVDRLAYRVVRAGRGAPSVAGETSRVR